MSLLKYIIRSSTRCTPYGSLSGVGLGKFSNSNDYSIDVPKLHFRVDNEWLIPILPKLEKEICNDIYVVKNADIEENDKKIVNHWVTYYYLENNENVNEIIINNTNVVKKILTLAQEYIKKEDLLNILLEIYGFERLNDINNILDQLQKYEILISNLRFCSFINDPLKEIVETAKKYNSTLLEKLRIIYYDLCDLNINFSILKYEKLISKMKEVYNCKNIVRVDSYYKSIINIDIEEKRKLTDYANFLANFSIDENKYNDHCKAFIDKFGNVKVPVKYAFDKYKDAQQGVTDNITNAAVLAQKSNLLDDAYVKIVELVAINLKSNVIDLSDLEIDDEIVQKNGTNLELAFYPILKKTEIYYITSPYCASNNLFESFGRFNYLFDENNSNFFNE